MGEVPKISVEVVPEPPASGDLVEFVPEGKRVSSDIPEEEFRGKKLSTLLLREGGRRRLYVGLGPQESIGPAILRKASGAAVRSLVKIGTEQISILAQEWEDHLDAIVEGALLGAYRFERYKPEALRSRTGLRQLWLCIAPRLRREAKEKAKLGQLVAEATNLVRDLGNEPGNVIFPEALAERAHQLAKEYGLSCRVFEPRELEEKGFGGLLAVGSGSVHGPRLILLEYSGKDPGRPPIALVGKAITFDSGGISLKPGERMDEMKFDKMGGCAVLGILCAASRLQLPTRVVGVLAAAENLPGPSAYRPGDIIRTYDGNTIEVLNTDAEGRIVLADAIAYVKKEFRPSLIIDLATLTGACIVALGKEKAGLFTPDRELREAFWSLGEEVNNPVWPLPLGEEFDEQIKSDIALVKNVGGKEGGACTAAAFLQKWVGDTRWVHLDIAGPAWITKEVAYLEKGPTGFGVSLITRFLLGQANQAQRTKPSQKGSGRKR